MPSPFAQAHLSRLEALRRIRHGLNGEPVQIMLLQRDPLTNELVDLQPITKSFAFGEPNPGDDGKLPPQSVQLELQVGEGLISAEVRSQAAAIQHGVTIWKVHSESPGAPRGMRRFWRFWLIGAEDLET